MSDPLSASDQIAHLIEMGRDVLAKKKPWPIDEFAALDTEAYAEWRVRSLNCLSRFFGPTSGYAGAFAGQVGQNAHPMHVREGIGILKAAKTDAEAGFVSTGSPDANFSPFLIVSKICSRFHLVARQIRTRHGSRPTLEVDDEYDVQDLLHALLKLEFEDIRPEEYTPSYAGKSTRMDFLLKEEQLVIEVKMTRNGLHEKEVGTQLIDDIKRYESHPDCKTLVCFVYDPDGKIGNPRGLETDLRRTGQPFPVEVLVRP